MSQSHNPAYETLISLAAGELESWLACATTPGGQPRLVVVERVPRVVSSNEGLLRDARQEVSRAAVVEHRSLVTVQDIFERGNSTYIARGFSPGESVDFLWRAYASAGEQVPLALTARVVAEAAAGLDFARRETSDTGRPLLHGHLSPQSLLLGYDGKTRVSGLGTWAIHRGISRARGGPGGRQLPYCAPERFQEGRCDARADIFAVGVILWELLTGKRLYHRNGSYEVMRAICEQPAPKPSSVASAVPTRLDPILQRALAKNPADRYSEYGEFLGALEELLQLPGIADQSMRLGDLLAEQFPVREDKWSSIADAERNGDFRHVSFVVRELEQSARRDAAPSAPQDETVVDTVQTATTQPRKPSSGRLDDTLQAHVEAAETHPDADATSGARPASRSPGEVDDDKPKRRKTALDTGGKARKQHRRRQRGGRASRPDEQAPLDRKGPSAAEPVGPPSSLGGGFDELDWSEAFGQFDRDDRADSPAPAPMSVDEIFEAREARWNSRSDERSNRSVVEIVRISDDRILAVDTLEGFKRILWDKTAPFSARLGLNEATITYDDPLDGWVRRKTHGQARHSLPEPGEKLKLAPGDQCELGAGQVAYRIRVLHAPRAPMRNRPQVTKKKLAIYAVAFALACLAHGGGLLGVLAVQALGVRMTVSDKPEQTEAFAEGTLADLEKPQEEEPEDHDQPDEPSPPTPKPTKPESKPADPAEQKAKMPETIRQKLTKRVHEKAQDASKDTVSDTQKTVDSLISSHSASGSSVEEVTSNLDSVKKPAGGSGGIDVRGTIDGLAGDEPNLAFGGGGKLADKAGGKGVGKDIGKLAERANKKKKVRGKVSSIRALSKVQGSLSHADVAKTIDRYIGQLNGCYESRLRDNPTLSGKVTFTWTIKTNGRVKGVRQRLSTLGDAKASRCINRVIKGMKFPKPKGGTVEISYPFVFQQR